MSNKYKFNKLSMHTKRFSMVLKAWQVFCFSIKISAIVKGHRKPSILTAKVPLL
jgi:hypothetical protein